VAVVAVAGGVLVWNARQDRSAPRPVAVPDLSSVAREGQGDYDRHCAKCHGVYGAGGEVGPPLVHPVYRSAHHADVAFALAVRRGVLAHHWRFGDMPAQPAVADDKLAAITRYIRELQAANGIE
jgi:mono/diheme cytochrome c family protein